MKVGGSSGPEARGAMDDERDLEAEDMLDPEDEPTEVGRIRVDLLVHRLGELETQLAAARGTITALMSREAGGGASDADLRRLEREVAERNRELLLAEARHRSFFAASPDAILVLDGERRVVEANPAAGRLFDRPPAALRGLDLAVLLPPAMGRGLAGLLDSGHIGEGESELRLRDGRRARFWVARPGAGEAILVLRPVGAPIRPRRPDGLQRLASKVAHEINNPLAVIQGRLDLLAARPPRGPEDLAAQLAVLQEHCRRIVRTTRNLQAFASPAPFRAASHPAREIVREALARFGRRAQRVRLRVQVRPEDLAIHGDRARLVHLLVNLVTRAVDASPDHGEVRLLVEGSGGGDADILLEHEGTGLDAEVLEQLGAGGLGESWRFAAPVDLGLAICQTFARDHRGTFTAENRRGGGARYRVLLPPAPR